MLLKFVRFFTPGRIRFILFSMRVSKRRRLIINVVTTTWQGWRFYRQVQHELTKEVTFETE